MEPDFRIYEQYTDHEFKFYFLTDGKNKKTKDIRRLFYSYIKTKSICNEITPEEEIDIILRCRLLRNIPRNKARLMLHAMGNALLEEINNINPDLFVSHMVDDYVTHLVSVIANRQGKKFIVYYPSYFTGYAQISLGPNGKAYDVRIPEDHEASNILQVISNSMYRQNYKQNNSYTILHHIKNILKYRLNKVIYSVKSIIENDRENAHYKTIAYMATRRYLSDYPKKCYFDLEWRKKLIKLTKANQRKIIYFPLAYFPESVVDYWIDDLSIICYEEKTLEIIDDLAKNFIVIIKEHIHMMGSRNKNFYSQIGKISNVINVYPLEYSNEIVKVADAVVLGGGSIGVEAAIRGKPIFSFCRNAYWFKHAKAFTLPLDNIDQWASIISNGINTFIPLTEEESKEFILACLRSTVPISGQGIIWPHIGFDDLKKIISPGTL